jgi:hypothetical protein
MDQIERNQEEQRKLRLMWEESEWRLQFLRTFSGQQHTRPTHEQLRMWDQRNRSSCSPWQIPPI